MFVVRIVWFLFVRLLCVFVFVRITYKCSRCEILVPSGASPVFVKWCSELGATLFQDAMCLHVHWIKMNNSICQSLTNCMKTTKRIIELYSPSDSSRGFKLTRKVAKFPQIYLFGVKCRRRVNVSDFYRATHMQVLNRWSDLQGDSRSLVLVPFDRLHMISIPLWLSVSCTVSELLYYHLFTQTNIPFTRYNQLYNWFDNRLDICLHDAAGCTTGCSTGLTTDCIV